MHTARSASRAARPSRSTVETVVAVSTGEGALATLGRVPAFNPGLPERGSLVHRVLQRFFEEQLRAGRPQAGEMWTSV